MHESQLFGLNVERPVSLQKFDHERDIRPFHWAAFMSNFNF